jgi:hypothetical protein
VATPGAMTRPGQIQPPAQPDPRRPGGPGGDLE